MAMHNVRTMEVGGTHVVGRAHDILSVYDRLWCDVIGLYETHRSGHSTFIQAGYLVYCSGEYGGENGGKKGVGLAVKISITRAARPPEFISDRLQKVTLGIRGRAKAVTFIVANVPTGTQNTSNKHAFWATFDKTVKEVPQHKQLFCVYRCQRPHGRWGSKEVWGARTKNISVPTAETSSMTMENYWCPMITTMNSYL